MFYDVHFGAQFFSILFVMLLATWAMTVIGTMFSALTVNLRLRELMLPILVYPFLLPALMAAMLLTTDLMAGTPLGGNNTIWLRVLVAFDFVFTGFVHGIHRCGSGRLRAYETREKLVYLLAAVAARCC